MHGIFTLITKNKKLLPKITVYWKNTFEFQPTFVHRKKSTQSYHIEQFTSQKFENEKLWLDTPDFFCVTEGVIHNMGDLCKLNNSKDYKGLINNYYKDNQKDFFKHFEGNFSGVFYDKNYNTCTAFNNQTGTKKMFYFQNSDYLIFTSDLKTLTKYLNDLQIPVSLNIDSAYLLLTSGFMHDNLTLFNEINQIRAGEYCISKNDTLTVKSYFNLASINQTKDSKKTIIENLDILFKEAVKLEYGADNANNFKHLTTLSGGLDSRMTALIAYKIGYKDQIMLNFSEKGYADEIIAKQITKVYNLEMIQLALNAQSMCAIDDVVAVNDGLTIYTGCSHAFSALKQINGFENGILHTGMIGDAVMGSFVCKIKETKPKISDGLYSKGLMGKAESIIKKSISNYPSEELYKFYNRAFMGANNGFQYYDLIGESSSPFLNSDFLSYAYSIPRKYKYKENIYIDWMNTLHPDIAKFTWEGIGGKPTNNEYLRQYYRYKRAIIKRLPIKTMWKNTMSPEQVWYDNNEDVKQTLDNYFDDNIHFLEHHNELRNDVVELYRSGNITEKTQAITLLSACKLHFG